MKTEFFNRISREKEKKKGRLNPLGLNQWALSNGSTHCKSADSPFLLLFCEDNEGFILGYNKDYEPSYW